VKLTRIMFDLDVQTEATRITCPTLVAHANRDAVTTVEEGRLLARLIPNARFLELDSPNHFMLPEEPARSTFVEALHAFLPAPASQQEPFSELTARERDILHRLAQGLDNDEIAADLAISEKTVRNHVSTIFDKMGVASRARAIVAARNAGYGVPPLGP
jgi:DNA-binding NarL/FixJ family response regulator